MNTRTAAALLRTHWRRLALMALSLAAVAAFMAVHPAAREVDAQLRALAQTPVGTLVAAVALLLLSQLARAVRWHRLLGWERGVSFAASWRELMAAQVLNWLLPIRLGEVARVARISAAPARVSGVWAASTVLIEKTADALILAGLALAAASLPGQDFWLRLGLLLAAGGLAGMAALMARRAGLTAWLARRYPALAERLLGGDAPAAQERSAAMRQPRRWLELIGLSGAVWAAGLLTNMVLADGLALFPGWAAHVALLVGLQAGSAIAALPANVGLFPIAAQLAFGPAGITEPRAAAFGAVLYVLVYAVNAVLWLVLTGLGFVARRQFQ